MLETLEIRNLALIEDLYIEFDKGFTVLTGETGAGKSIILGALNLILGERADASFVRSGSAEATVSATLSIAEEHTLHSWLKEREIEVKGESLVVRRVLKSSGRSSNYLQSAPV